MATWGAWKNNRSGNGMRLGYSLTQSPSKVGTGTTSVTVRLEIWVQTKASVYDSMNSFRVSGHYSYSGSKPFTSGTTKLYSATRSVSTKYGSSTRIHFSSSLSGINAIPGTASVSGSTTVGARPIVAPYAPSNATVTQHSDTKHTIRWKNNSPTAAAQPYEKILVQRYDINHVWRTMATLKGSATSYTNTSTSANNKYRWRVRAQNSAGNSGFTYTGYWSTSPWTAANLKATKTANDIKLTWETRAARQTGLEILHAANGVWDSGRLVLLSGTPETWTHSNPDPLVTHTYRIRTLAGQDDDAPTQYSVYSENSNVIQLLTNPAAPTKLGPSSGVFDATEDIRVTWQHNDVDSTSQTAYDLRYRIDGGEWEQLPKLNASVNAKRFLADTFENGVQVEWQVRTYGQYAKSPAYSPWSATALIETSARPEAALVYPTEEGGVDTSKISVEWAYYDEEDTEQAQYRVRLYSEDGERVLEDYAGSGDDNSHALTTILKNDRTYRIGVQVQDGSGLWSPEATEDFLVEYALPPVPEIQAEWDSELGAVNLSIVNEVADDDEAETVYNEVWRSIDWETYELVATGVPPNTTITDYIPAIGGDNVYLVVAYSDIGAAAESIPLVFSVPPNGEWFWLNGGAAFEVLCRIRYNPSLTRDFSREKTLNHFAGRNFPVETAGEHRNRTLDLSALVLGADDASMETLEVLADKSAPICLRSPDGERRYVSVGSVSGSSSGTGYTAGISMEQISRPNFLTMDMEPVVLRTNLNPDPKALDPAHYTISGEAFGVAPGQGTPGDHVWIQPEAPDAGTTYAWEGIAHGSSSVQFEDGAESRRNLYNNPRPVDSTRWSSQTPASEGSFDPEIGPSGFGSVSRLITEAGFLRLIAQGSSGILKAGDELHFSGWFYSERAMGLDLEINWTGPDYSGWEKYDVTGGVRIETGWNALDAIILVPEQATRAQQNQLYSGSYVRPGETFKASGVLLEVNTTGPYFDGDTPDDRAGDVWIGDIPHVWKKGTGWVAAVETAALEASTVGEDATLHAVGQDGERALYVETTEDFLVDDLKLQAGDEITVSADVFVDVEMSVKIRAMAYGDLEFSAPRGATPQLPNGKWVRHTMTQEITSLEEGGHFRALISGEGATLAEGEGFHVKNVMVEVNNEGPYFDGDTVPVEGKDLYKSRWTGEPDNSTSELTRGGETA